MRISDCEQLFEITHDEKAFRINENKKKVRKKIEKNVKADQKNQHSKCQNYKRKNDFKLWENLNIVLFSNII